MNTPGITLEVAQRHLEKWLAAEEAVTTGQGYSIGGRSLTRANLKEIRETIDYWNSHVQRLSRTKAGRNRITRVVPRDL